MKLMLPSFSKVMLTLEQPAWVVMALHRRTRHRLSGLKNKILPYDGHYKGLLELTFEDDLICGFRTYWPNGSNSEFTGRQRRVVFEEKAPAEVLADVRERLRALLGL
jgi:hypothetical protein